VVAGSIAEPDAGKEKERAPKHFGDAGMVHLLMAITIINVWKPPGGEHPTRTCRT
jgi:hypothetical protein